MFRALYLGDLICATPALQALRTCFPEAEVTLIGLPWAQEMVDRLPSLDRLSVFRGYPGLPETLFDAVRTDAFFNEARAEGYDLVVQMHGRGPASNQFVAQLGGRMSLGFAAGAEDRLTTVLPWREEEHEVQRWLRLVAALGAPVDVGRVAFPLGVRDRVQADDLLAHVPFGRGPLIGLHAGAKDPARRWPVGRFAELADRLASGLDARFVLTGTAGERFVTAELATAMRAPALDLTGHTDLGALAAVIERLDLLVTNDTGASHLAAAVGTPSVIVFGPSSPARWAPLNHDLHRAVDARLLADQPLDGAMALASLPVGPVLAACETVLAKGRERVVIGSATSKHPVLEALCDD